MDDMISVNKNTQLENKNNTSIDLPDPLKKYKKLYVIFPFIGAGLLFVTAFNPIAALFGGVIGTLIAWFIIAAISMIKVMRLNFTNYSLSAPITQNQLFEYLKNNFTHPDIEIDKGFLGVKFIYKRTTIHTIYLNEDKINFSISSTMTTKARLKNGGETSSARLYRNTVQAIPIIQKAIEEATISINASK